MQSTSVADGRVAEDSLVTFWQTLHQFPKQQPSALTSTLSSVSPDPVLPSVETSVQATQWVITNRGGFTLITGLVMVPSQFTISMDAARKVIEEVANTNQTIECVKLTLEDGSTLESIIYYPRDWDRKDKSRAVLYHNPERRNNLRLLCKQQT